jgi:hypothetical protein
MLPLTAKMIGVVGVIFLVREIRFYEFDLGLKKT